MQAKACIERAKDGVLFVDEAYRLKVDSEKDYGKEALDTLMEAMLGGKSRDDICRLSSANGGFHKVESRF